MDDEGIEASDGPLFYQAYLTCWASVRPYSLGLYGLKHLVKAMEGETNESKVEEEEGYEEEEEHEV